MNAIHDGYEDAKNSPCSGATANARKYTVSAFSVLSKHLRKRKAYTKRIPHMLNDNQHVRCVLLSALHFQSGRTEKQAFSFPAF